jgi:hypothetical protein
LSGADFDIDKEYINRYDFYTQRDESGNVSLRNMAMLLLMERNGKNISNGWLITTKLLKESSLRMLIYTSVL